ncbi:hypothetical protein LMG33810_001465 [Carnimonas sp. LMG 33810]
MNYPNVVHSSIQLFCECCVTDQAAAGWIEFRLRPPYSAAPIRVVVPSATVILSLKGVDIQCLNAQS